MPHSPIRFFSYFNDKKERKKDKIKFIITGRRSVSRHLGRRMTTSTKCSCSRSSTMTSMPVFFTRSTDWRMVFMAMRKSRVTDLRLAYCFLVSLTRSFLTRSSVCFTFQPLAKISSSTCFCKNPSFNGRSARA